MTPMTDYTRREFLATQAASILTSLAPGMLASQTPAGESAMEIIDCHTHFYDPTRPQGVPWPPTASRLYRTVLPEHLNALPKPRPITGTVVVEASAWIEDNDWLLELAEREPLIVGIVGNINPIDPDFAPHLKRLARNKFFRGIRVAASKLTEKLKAEDWTELHLLAEHDRSLDINGDFTSFELAAQIGARIPSLRIIVNHLGNIPITKEPPTKEWIRAVNTGASRPNVFSKLSGLVESASRNGQTAPRDPEFYAPYLDVVWNAFSDHRVIYGSNWPVSETGADYATVQKLTMDYARGKGAESSRRFLSENAKRAYQWIERRKGR